MAEPKSGINIHGCLDPLLISLWAREDGLAAVWHLLEFFGNTILFVLCGVFSYTSTKNVQWTDYGWLVLLYILANLARGVMVGVLLPVLNCVGGSDVTPLACDMGVS